MNYTLIKNVLDILAEFEKEYAFANQTTANIDDFKKWFLSKQISANVAPDWEGKALGRSPDSVINTLLVHMNRYAKSYSKAVITDSEFSTQEDFIYLINLKAFGEMTKMDLIKKNVHEKPVGMQIINRLIEKGWVEQKPSVMDRRSKVLKLKSTGLHMLESHMDNIRKASKIVTGNLTESEKLELIRILNKLNDFHKPIYDRNIDPRYLLEEATKNDTYEN